MAQFAYCAILFFGGVKLISENGELFAIRKALISDVEQINNLYINHLAKNYLTKNPPTEPKDIDEWRELLTEILTDKNYYILVCDIDGIIVSSVTIIVIKNSTHNLRPYALIENVVTHSEYRCKGYASALINKAVEIAVESNCYKVMLMTGSKKESTLRFYENCGFDKNEKTAFLRKL